MGAVYDLDCTFCCGDCRCTRDEYGLTIGGVVAKDPDVCGQEFGAHTCDMWNTTWTVTWQGGCNYSLCDHLCNTPGNQFALQLRFIEQPATGKIRAEVTLWTFIAWSAENPDECNSAPEPMIAQWEEDFDSCIEAEGLLTRTYLIAHGGFACDFTNVTCVLVKI